jgi:hypothetical protein
MMIRNLAPSERLPSVVVTGFEQLPIDESWCWHAIHEGTIIGTLVCAPAHGVVLLLRLAIHPSAPKHAFRALLRTMFRDTHARGYVGYIALLGPTREREGRMLKILRHIGGKQMLEPVVLIHGVNPCHN